MPAKSKLDRRPGRPKNEPMSAYELRQRAQANIKDSAERRGQINFSETAEDLRLMLDTKRMEELTRSEIKELRRKAEQLWDKFEIERQYAEELERTFGVRNDPPPEIVAEWEQQHAFLKPKRKNAKKLHNIYDLPENKREAKGLASAPTPMEFDVDATEAELEDKLMDAAIEQRKQDRQFLKGRRITGRAKANPANDLKKRFWT